MRVYANTIFQTPPTGDSDPITYKLDGLMIGDEEDSWELISAGQFDLDWVDGGVPDRNPPGQPINSTYYDGDPNLSFGYVRFQNNEAYSKYRIIFPTLRSDRPDPSQFYTLVVGEVELMGAIQPQDPTESPTSGPTSPPTPYVCPATDENCQPDGCDGVCEGARGTIGDGSCIGESADDKVCVDLNGNVGSNSCIYPKACEKLKGE
jgi:hypothetical protein